MTELAVNVTLVPGQIVFPGAFEEIVTLTGRLSLTVTAMALLVAGLPAAHGAMFEVKVTVTISPLLSDVAV